MADIFISYSKPDRLLVEKLSVYLQSEGWGTWWDKGLTAGDSFRDEIMKQLVAARAVIVLWTPNSIISDFVRAEAGRAKADGKLIPVKAEDIDYDDIPLPFGEMHTEPLTNLALIRAAVVGQLAKPAARPSPFLQLTASVRYAALTWLGILGGAITLFANLQNLVKFADWMSLLVTNWQYVTHEVWSRFAGLVGIRIPNYFSPILTFIVFTLALTMGTRRQIERLGSSPTTTSVRPWKEVIRLVCVKYLMLSVLLLIVIYVGTKYSGTEFDFALSKVSMAVLCAICLYGEPQKYSGILTVFGLSGCFIFLVHEGISKVGAEEQLVATIPAVVVYFFILASMVAVVPPRAINWRLLKLVIVVLLMLGTSTVSNWIMLSARP